MIFYKKHIIGIFLLLLSIISFLLVESTITFAADVNTASSGTTQSSATNSNKPVDAHYNVHNTSTVDVTQFSKFTEDRSIGGFAQRILVFFMAILGGVAMLGIIAGGVMIMMGGVSETTMEQGKDLLYYSVIGVVIALLSMVIVTLSQSFFYSLGT